MSQFSRTPRAAAVLTLLACAFMLPAARASAPDSGHRTPPHVERAHTVRHGAKPAQLAPAAGTAAFGLDLLDQSGTGNVVLSPDSVEAALAMVASGAKGRTAQQIATALHLRSPAAFAQVGKLQREIALEQIAAAAGSPLQPTLDIANGLFLQRGFPTSEPFLLGLEKNFGATAQPVDFTNGSEAVQAINAWVSAHTQGIIPAAIGSLPSSTVLALANAIYLKAVWSAPFKTRDTAPAPFHAAQGSSSVPFMNETEEFPYTHGRDYSAIDIPYAASTLSMLVVMPKRGGLARFQRQLDPAMLTRIVRGLARRPVALSLPRFHVAFAQSLVGTLKNLGITDAFNANRANFSGISPMGLVLNEVAHAADLKVDEEGTIAAAATVVGAEAVDLRVFRPSPIPFIADRPFLFFLRDDRSGAVLFAGRLSNAAAAQD